MKKEATPIGTAKLVEDALAKYNVTDAFIAEAKEKALAIVVKDPTDKKAADTAHDLRMVLRSKRIEVEKTRKLLKEDALRYGQAVDAEARRITGQIEPLEDHLQTQEDIVRKHAERMERERQEKLAQEKAEREAREQAEREAEELRLRQEREKLEAEKAAFEAEKRRAEEERLVAEREKRHQEEVEAARKEAAEKAEKEAEVRAQREREEAEARVRRAEEDAARAKAEAERARIEAEARAKKEREDAEAAEAERRASAPDREKLRRFAEDLIAVPVPECSGKYAKIVAAAVVLIAQAKNTLLDGAK
jgi:hypothetical protein